MTLQHKPKLTKRQLQKRLEKVRALIHKDVLPFEDDTPEKQQARIARSLVDKEYFFTTYLPHYFNKQAAEFHEEWNDLADIKGTPVALGAPRGFSKSVRVTFGDTIYRIAHKLMWFRFIISDTEDQAISGHTIYIKLELEENLRIEHDFGKMKGSPWGDGDFTTASGVRVKARGGKQKVRGFKNRQHRPDSAVIDDFENDKSVQNQKLVDESVRWIFESLWPALDKKNRSLIILGQIPTRKCVMAQMINREDMDGEKVCISGIYKALNDNDESNWPEVHSTEILHQDRRIMGAISFGKEMMLESKGDSDIFPEDKTTYYTLDEIRNLPLRKFAYIDPAMKSGEHNDYKTIVVVGTYNLIFYVLYAWLRKASIGRMLTAAYNAHAEFGPERWQQEDNGIGEYGMEVFDNKAKEMGFHLPLKPITHSTSKESRIVRLNPPWENGRIRFLKGHSDQPRLIEQCWDYPGANDDGPDSLEGAIEMAENVGGKKVFVPIVGLDENWREQQPNGLV